MRPGSDFKVIVCQDSCQSDYVITAAENLSGSRLGALHRWKCSRDKALLGTPARVHWLSGNLDKKRGSKSVGGVQDPHWRTQYADATRDV